MTCAVVACGAELYGTSRLVVESGSAVDVVGSTESLVDVLAGMFSVLRSGSLDVSAESKSMLNCFDRSGTEGSVVEAVMSPDVLCCVTEAFLALAIGMCMSLTWTDVVVVRLCHSGWVTEDADLGCLMLLRTVECSCCVGTCLTSVTADRINHATSESG